MTSSLSELSGLCGWSSMLASKRELDSLYGSSSSLSSKVRPWKSLWEMESFSFGALDLFGLRLRGLSAWRWVRNARSTSVVISFVRFSVVVAITIEMVVWSCFFSSCYTWVLKDSNSCLIDSIDVLSLWDTLVVRSEVSGWFETCDSVRIFLSSVEFVLTIISYGKLVQVPVLTYLVGILRAALRGVRRSQRRWRKCRWKSPAREWGHLTSCGGPFQKRKMTLCQLTRKGKLTKNWSKMRQKRRRWPIQRQPKHLTEPATTSFPYSQQQSASVSSYKSVLVYPVSTLFVMS